MMPLEFLDKAVVKEYLQEENPEKLHKWATDIVEQVINLPENADLGLDIVSGIFSTASFFQARAAYFAARQNKSFKS